MIGEMMKTYKRKPIWVNYIELTGHRFVVSGNEK